MADDKKAPRSPRALPAQPMTPAQHCRIKAVDIAVINRTGGESMIELVKRAEMLAEYLENGTIPSQP